MPGFGNGKFEKTTVFQFSSKQIFSISVVSAIVTTTAVAFAARASLALSTSSGELVLVSVTGPSVDVSVCLRHDDIIIVLYNSMR